MDDDVMVSVLVPRELSTAREVQVSVKALRRARGAAASYARPNVTSPAGVQHYQDAVDELTAVLGLEVGDYVRGEPRQPGAWYRGRIVQELGDDVFLVRYNGDISGLHAWGGAAELEVQAIATALRYAS